MSIKDQIRAEIERLNSLVSYESKDRHDDGLHDAYKAVKKVIDSIPEQPASEGLEEEMDEIWLEYCEDVDYLVYASIARHFAEWGMVQCPLPEDTTIFLKGVAEGRRLEKDDNISLIESRIAEILGDAQPAPIFRTELRELIEKIKK